MFWFQSVVEYPDAPLSIWKYIECRHRVCSRQVLGIHRRFVKSNDIQGITFWKIYNKVIALQNFYCEKCPNKYTNRCIRIFPNEIKTANKFVSFIMKAMYIQIEPCKFPAINWQLFLHPVLKEVRFWNISNTCTDKFLSKSSICMLRIAIT